MICKVYDTVKNYKIIFLCM